MSDVLKEPLSQNAYTSQIRIASEHISIFLLWVIFAGFFTLFLFYFNFNDVSTYLNNWFIALCLICTSSWLTIKRSLSKKTSNLKYLNIINQFFCLLLGCTLGIGIYLIYQYFTIKNDEITILHLMTLANSLLSMIFIMGINHLTKKFCYFLLLFIPAISPVLLVELFSKNTIPPQYILMQDVWFAMIFVAAFISHQIYKKKLNLNLRNMKLITQSQQYLNQSRLLRNKLQQEVIATETMQEQLDFNNLLLETKVIARTQNIKQLNDHLSNQQTNLNFAHETAGIHSWLWNIEDKTYTFSRNLQEFDEEISLGTKNDCTIHPDDLDNYKKEMRKHLRGLTDRFEATYRVKQDNQWIWIQDIGRVILRHPVSRKPLRMVGIFRDIQKEMNDQEQIRLAASVFDHVAEGIFVLDQNFCFLNINPFFEKLLNFSIEEVKGKHLFDLTENTKARTKNHHDEFIRQLLEVGEYETEIYEQFISGKRLTISVHINAITDSQNRVISYVGIITDLTERIKQEQRLSYLENFDLLTDLPNRFYFNQQLHHYVTSKNQTLKYFALIRINIDRFRSFNESLSAQAGDELLKQVAERLRQSCSDALLIAYLNNDDFAIIYNLEYNNLSIQKYAQMIFNAFKQPFTILDKEQTISISMGIALYPEHGRQIHSLNSHAEFALEEAKRMGGNTMHFYANQSGQLLNHGINLESELRKAIKNDEFTVYYQPKVCIHSQKIIGFEALVRWQHPELGLVQPDMFIPLAEETSLITEIGQFVLFETCKQLKLWQQAGFNDIRVSVNIVAQQIHRGQLLKDIDLALESNQLSGEMLDIELTESSLLDKSDHVIQLLEQIKERKISISLDDFGTGYSSLAYLTYYPIDALKIDQAFINRIGKEKDEAIVNAIIVLGKTIGMTIVAEGVETAEQVEFLKNRGCYILQGYYFSKPLTAQQSTEYLEQNKLIGDFS